MEEVNIEPAESDGAIRIRPIGVARSPVCTQPTGGLEQVTSQIELRLEFVPFLQGMEEYSHVTVVCWLSEQRRAFASTRTQGLHELAVQADTPTSALFNLSELKGHEARYGPLIVSLGRSLPSRERGDPVRPPAPWSGYRLGGVLGAESQRWSPRKEAAPHAVQFGPVSPAGQ